MKELFTKEEVEKMYVGYLEDATKCGLKFSLMGTDQIDCDAYEVEFSVEGPIENVIKFRDNVHSYHNGTGWYEYNSKSYDDDAPIDTATFLFF